MISGNHNYDVDDPPDVPLADHCMVEHETRRETFEATTGAVLAFAKAISPLTNQQSTCSKDPSTEWCIPNEQSSTLITSNIIITQLSHYMYKSYNMHVIVVYFVMKSFWSKSHFAWITSGAKMKS